LCPKCNGRGKYAGGSDCDKCHGDGQIEHSVKCIISW
jgi:DnaJ-class molecular chaperone